ncbi:hypothetical protein CAPTEDRAFT_213822 [Capitella teleta]|uniref:Uncharacterized protein n=1 Tax=Capitella teleta TaxID=283909 RepID=R7UER3_CAPTE|nr:hypothetical protein CAPTEDRAFT_213822 [Capitella teleta]|eukprot:ELU02283.1 hypothetical protein CAPTEDRAFT_213822 [Capitella teleta]
MVPWYRSHASATAQDCTLWFRSELLMLAENASGSMFFSFCTVMTLVTFFGLGRSRVNSTHACMVGGDGKISPFNLTSQARETTDNKVYDAPILVDSSAHMLGKAVCIDERVQLARKQVGVRTVHVEVEIAQHKQFSRRGDQSHTPSLAVRTRDVQQRVSSRSHRTHGNGINITDSDPSFGQSQKVEVLFDDQIMYLRRFVSSGVLLLRRTCVQQSGSKGEHWFVCVGRHMEEIADVYSTIS